MRRTILASGAVAALLLLAGCSASSGSASDSSSSGSGPVQMEPGQPGPAREGDSFSSEEGGVTDADGAAVDQSVITTGWVTITVDDPTAAAERAIEIVDAADGRIDSRSQQAGSDSQRSSAQLVVRIPADDVDETLESLKELGEVDQISLSSNDVTLQVRDLDAQIAALKASVSRLLELVDQAATTADLVELETAISDRQAQLDSLTSQKEYLSDQIAYSTITLDLAEKGALPSNVPGDFWSGLAAGWASLTAALGGLVVVIGVLIPWLLPLAVIAAVIVLIVLLSRRRPKPQPRASGAQGGPGSPAPSGAATSQIASDASPGQAQNAPHPHG
jgi:hypothetical protein